MATLLFIDTNIWLDFYRSNNEAGISLLNRLKDLSKFILVTDQLEMEFKKNRQNVILESVKGLKPPPGVSIPAFLNSENDEVKLDRAIQEAQQLVESIKNNLPKMLEDPGANDQVYQICSGVFGKNDRLCYRVHNPRWREIKDAALTRYQRGYPPRKPGDTSMGDAVNWEWIVYSTRTLKRNVVIVSRDSDYGQFHDGKAYLNDQLRQEFTDRVGKEYRITLYRTITAALKDFQVIVTPKEEQEENSIIQSLDDSTRLKREALAELLTQRELSDDPPSSLLTLLGFLSSLRKSTGEDKKQSKEGENGTS